MTGDGELPPDNNWVENQLRPIAIGRSNWLFAGSLRAGQRAAAIMSLVHSARLNGHEPHSLDLSSWQHRHDWAADRSASARRTHAVIVITLLTMVAEIAASWWWQSMPSLADDWHMGTHAVAIGVAALAHVSIQVNRCTQAGARPV